MITVGLKALKNNLSKYVRAAAAGETVRITDRDRVVAEIGPPCEAREMDGLSPGIREAIRQGHIRPPLTRYIPLSRSPDDVHIPIEQVLEDLDRDRENR